MRNSTMESIILFIFGVVLGASSSSISPSDSHSADFLRQERRHELNTHEALVQVYGLPKSSTDLSFGDNPVIERQKNSNVKTSQRKTLIRKDSEEREPSIQAYGLPKVTVEDNGSIERVNFDRVSGLDGKVNKVNLEGEKPGIHAYGLPKRVVEDNGFIERIGNNDESNPDLVSEKIRKIRSNDNKSSKNDLIDLEAQEAKVFRPLFVYRQQVADRYRVKPRKNPIYGAYQYGTNYRHRNHVNGINRNYY